MSAGRGGVDSRRARVVGGGDLEVALGELVARAGARGDAVGIDDRRLVVGDLSDQAMVTGCTFRNSPHTSVDVTETTDRCLMRRPACISRVLSDSVQPEGNRTVLKEMEEVPCRPWIIP